MEHKSAPETLAQSPSERYRLIEPGADQYLIYDRENTAAWIQADHCVEVSE